MPPITWRCPACDRTLRALASYAGHRCPARRMAWVTWLSEPAEADR